MAAPTTCGRPDAGLTVAVMVVMGSPSWSPGRDLASREGAHRPPTSGRPRPGRRAAGGLVGGVAGATPVRTLRAGPAAGSAATAPRAAVIRSAAAGLRRRRTGRPASGRGRAGTWLGEPVRAPGTAALDEVAGVAEPDPRTRRCSVRLGPPHPPGSRSWAGTVRAGRSTWRGWGGYGWPDSTPKRRSRAQASFARLGELAVGGGHPHVDVGLVGGVQRAVGVAKLSGRGGV